MAHLFVGQLPFSNFYAADLHALFSEYGTIISSKLNLKRGEAFITYEFSSDADAAIEGLHGKRTVKGRKQPMQVMYANSSLKWSWYGLRHNLTLHHQNRASVKLPKFLSHTPPLSPSQWAPAHPFRAPAHGAALEAEIGESPLPSSSAHSRSAAERRGDSSTTTTTTGTTSSSPFFSTNSQSNSTRSSGVSYHSDNNSKNSSQSSSSKTTSQRKRSRDIQHEDTETAVPTDVHKPHRSCKGNEKEPAKADETGKKKRRKKKLRMEDEEDIDSHNRDSQFVMSAASAAETESIQTSTSSAPQVPSRQQQRVRSHPVIAPPHHYHNHRSYLHLPHGGGAASGPSSATQPPYSHPPSTGRGRESSRSRMSAPTYSLAPPAEQQMLDYAAESAGSGRKRGRGGGRGGRGGR